MAPASLHVTSSSSSRRRRDSPSNASFPSPSCGSQVLPVSPPTDDDVDHIPPHIDGVADLVPPPKGEVVVDAKPEAFGDGPVDLSLLTLYPDHIAMHIWDGEVALVGFFIYFYVNFNF